MRKSNSGGDDLSLLSDKGRSKLINNFGFTMTELMIAVGLMGVAMFAAISMLVHTQQDNVSAIDRNAAETSLVAAELYLRDYLGQGVDVHYTGNNLDSQTGAGGQMREFDSVSAPAYPTTIALFNREVGSKEDGTPAIRHSVFAPYAMFFIPPAPPSAAENSKTGVIFLNTTDPADGKLHANYNDQFIPDIVELTVRNPQTYSGSVSEGSILTSMDIRIVVRYFEPGQSPKQWCPHRPPTYDFASSACAGKPFRPFHDLEKIITLKFRNNANPNGTLLGDVPLTRLFGSLYFFPVGHVSN